MNKKKNENLKSIGGQLQQYHLFVGYAGDNDPVVDHSLPHGDRGEHASNLGEAASHRYTLVLVHFIILLLLPAAPLLLFLPLIGTVLFLLFYLGLFSFYLIPSRF